MFKNIVIALLSILFVVITFSCEQEVISIVEPMPPEDTLSMDNSITYLALGDSYTIGESVAESDRFPVQLVEKLKTDHLEIDDLTIVARTGWTTDELKSAISNTDLSKAPYDIVSLLIGVNNQFRGRALDNYKVEFEDLLKTAIQLSGNQAARVIVLSIPDYGVTPFITSEAAAERIAREIDLFNAAAAEICQANQVYFLDITPISRQAATDATLIATDGLHPSGVMYGSWVDLMLPQVKEMLME
jgi:lysophospholipase L1-like esterase